MIAVYETVKGRPHLCNLTLTRLVHVWLITRSIIPLVTKSHTSRGWLWAIPPSRYLEISLPRVIATNQWRHSACVVIVLSIATRNSIRHVEVLGSSGSTMNLSTSHREALASNWNIGLFRDCNSFAKWSASSQVSCSHLYNFPRPVGGGGGGGGGVQCYHFCTHKTPQIISLAFYS